MDPDELAKRWGRFRRRPLRTTVLILAVGFLAGAGAVGTGALSELGKLLIPARESHTPLQTTPTLRFSYYVFEGPTLLDRSLRGYSFSRVDGFAFRPYWLKNDIFRNLENLLKLNTVGRSKQLPFDVMTFFAGAPDGSEHFYLHLHSGDGDSGAERPATTRHHFHGGIAPFRGPSLFGPVNVEDLLHRIRSDPFWTIQATSWNQPLGPYEYAFFGLPTRDEALRLVRDPISRAVLEEPANEDLRDVVFLVIQPAHGAYHGRVRIRELKLLSLAIENIGDKPVGVKALRQRELVADGTFRIRREEDHATAVNRANVLERKVPIEFLTPGEQLLIPLNLQLGFATKLGDPSRDYNGEDCVTEEAIPRKWWLDQVKGEDVTLEIVRGIDSQHREVTDQVRVPKSLLAAKTAFDANIMSRYYIGGAVDVVEVVFGLAGGKEKAVPVRRFDPMNLVGRGAFASGSCPILYIDHHGRWRRFGPVLVNAVSQTRRQTERVRVPAGAARFRIREEEAETSFVERIELWVFDRAGERRALAASVSSDGASHGSGGYVLRRGDTIEVKFEERGIPGEVFRELVIVGYYVPDNAFPNIARQGARGGSMSR